MPVSKVHLLKVSNAQNSPSPHCVECHLEDIHFLIPFTGDKESRAKRPSNDGAEDSAKRQRTERAQQQTLIETGVAKANAANRLALVGIYATLLSVAMFLIVEHMPVLKFPALLALLAYHGKDEINKKYNHCRYFWSVLYALSDVMLRDQLKDVNSSPFFSLMCDSSPDAGGQDHLLIYLRYCNPVSLKFVNQYLCCVRVAVKDGATMFDIVRMVIQVLNLDETKLVGLCTDGDSVFTGVNIGLASRIKQAINCCLIAVHCVAHKCSLVLTDATSSKRENREAIVTIDKVLASVHNLFAHATKRSAMWEIYASKRGVTKLSFPRYNDTRWFSRIQCIIVLTENVHVLIGFLEMCVQEARAAKQPWYAAENLLPIITDVEVLAQLFVLRDVLEPMHELSLKCQSDKCLPHEVGHAVQECLDLILLMSTSALVV